MKRKILNVLIFIAILIISTFFIVMWQHKAQKSNRITKKETQYILANFGLSEKTISIGGVTLQVEIAQTPKEKATGLSHRSSLAEGRGMLFVFEGESDHSFWMKDMHFLIDIIWINTEKRVVHIERNIAPDTYPQSFRSPIPARYVLEVPAEYAQDVIGIGSLLIIK